MGTIRKPIKKTSIEKKKRIIEKGFELMCNKGYHNVSCVDIAKYAGVSTGLIYQYFTDKKDIFLEGVKDYSNKIMFPMINILDNKAFDKNNLRDILSQMIDSFINTHTMKKEAHEELSKPQAPNLAHLLSDYYSGRNAGAWSQKAKIGNIKEFNEIVNYLMQNKLTTPEELQERVSALSDRIDTLKNSMRGKSNRMKELDELLRMVQFYTKGKPVADKLATIKWKGKREQFMSENENALRLYHMAERKLKPHFKDGKLPITAWRKERDRLEQEYKTGQAELSPIYAEVKKLWQIKYKVEQVIHEQERQNAVTRQKKQEIEH